VDAEVLRQGFKQRMAYMKAPQGQLNLKMKHKQEFVLKDFIVKGRENYEKEFVKSVDHKPRPLNIIGSMCDNCQSSTDNSIIVDGYG
jgi:hypothetical protein